MPIYEYECTSCGDRFEVMQKFSDTPYEDCLHCGGKVKKLMGTPALQFKGTGWYITDYAGKSPKPPESKAAKAAKAEKAEKAETAEKKDASNAASK